jgi:ATP-dependent protease HslVU (ClpYQ) peptidase subunit
VTVLVGVRCSDGVVIGADSAATSSAGQFPVMDLPYDGKIRIFQDNIIVAASGPVGHCQRLHAHVEEAIAGGVFKMPKLRECIANISKRVLTDFQNSMVQMHPTEGLRFGALIATVHTNEPFLAEYSGINFQPEIKKDSLFFVSLGSGQILADPFLAFVSRVMWQNAIPTVEDATFGVYWVLDHTIKLASGKVRGPPHLVTLKKVDGAWVAKEQDTQEAAEYTTALEKYIGGFAPQGPIDAEQAEPIPQPKPAEDA